LLGIIGGTAAIPPKWSDPVGEAISLHQFTRTTKAPKTIQECTIRTVSLARQFSERPDSPVEFGDRTDVPAEALLRLRHAAGAHAALREDLRASWAADGEMDVIMHWHGDPVMRPGETRTLRVSFRRDGAALEGTPKLEVPDGWKSVADGSSFTVTAGPIGKSARIGVTAEVAGRSWRTEFTVLGPDDAKGWPAAVNVEYCPVCHGRKGSCLCRT
jgi:hypothetical protein